MPKNPDFLFLSNALEYVTSVVLSPYAAKKRIREKLENGELAAKADKITHQRTCWTIVLLWELFQAPSERRTFSSNSRPRGWNLDESDAPLLTDMRRLLDSGECLSPTAAAKEVVSRAKGFGTPDSKIRRLVRSYKKRFQGP